jgi:hypothetical protein
LDCLPRDKRRGGNVLFTRPAARERGARRRARAARARRAMALLGTRLILDVRASVPGLLPYQDETVRALAAEAASLAAGIDAQLAEGGAADAFAGTVVQAATLRRAKRCLVAYHAARCERIEALRWNAGSVLSAGAREKLSNSEVDYFREYGAAVTAYAEAAKVDVAAVRGAAAALFRRAARGPHAFHPSSSSTPARPPPLFSRSSRRKTTACRCARSRTLASSSRRAACASCAWARRTLCRAATPSRSCARGSWCSCRRTERR